MNQIKTNILILGAGIGGYETFRSLARRLKSKGLNKTITIVDQNNYFTFTPLMHEVAVGAVEPGHATLSLANLVAGTPHRFVKGRVQHIDPRKKEVSLAGDDVAVDAITYDYCVVAIGSAINYYDIPGAAEYSYHIRTLRNALDFRHALINRYDSSDQHISVSVVGGGPTGIEVVGHVAHLMNRDLKRLYPQKTISIKLIEKGDSIGRVLPAAAQRLATKRLKQMGVEIITDMGVTSVAADAIMLGTGKTIESDLTLWSVGMRNVACDILHEDFTHRGRVMVDDHLQVPNAPGLYAIGDVACVDTPTGPVPQLGEAAMEEGKYVARHIIAYFQNKTTKPFQFHSLGTLLPVGEHYAIIIRGNKVWGAGFFAWWVRRTVYVWFMPGIIRKIKIILDWTLRLFGTVDIISLRKSEKN